MPVRKFRDLTEAERALWMEPGDPRIWEAMCRRWAIRLFFSPPRRKSSPGVFKYASMAEKHRHEEQGS